MLLDAGLGINQEAFSEKDFKATPLWYAVAFGQNLKLAEFLLTARFGSPLLHVGCGIQR